MITFFSLLSIWGIISFIRILLHSIKINKPFSYCLTDLTLYDFMGVYYLFIFLACFFTYICFKYLP